METPIYHLSEKDMDTVYTPSEDTFLLMDAIESDFSTLKSLKPLICLEIGSGSGIIITSLAMHFRKHQHHAYYLAIDVNPEACRVTKQTTLLNTVNVEVLQMDLLSCLSSKSTFDVILFNPPYVLTEDNEIVAGNMLARAWAGGENGRKVMERVFEKVPKILSANGLFYLLVIKENDPEYILKSLEGSNMEGCIIAERKIRGEHLYILRFKKISENCI